MSSFFAQATKRVEIDAENSVTIRKLNYGQRQDSVGGATRINPLTQEASIDIPRLRLEQLHAAIVSWEGPGFEGRPVSKENIKALPTDVAEKIEQALDGWDTPLSETEKKA